MAEERRRLTLQEMEEFSLQIDEIVARHSPDIILPVLSGLLDGIATNPRALDKTTWNTRIVKSDSLGLTVPTFTVFFQIQNEGKDDEFVLLLWIQENNPVDEITGL